MQPESRLSGIACAVSLAAILTVAGCNARQDADTVSASSTEPAAVRVPTVRTIEALTRPIAASVQVTGSFVAKETSDVAPEAAGRVVETFVNVGSQLKCGQASSKGWYYDDPVNPTTISLCSGACSNVQASAMGQVDLVFGCTTLVL